MPLVNRSTSIPANSTVDNILSGSAFEYLPSNAAMQFGIVQATGNVADLLVTVQSGSDILQEEAPVIVNNAWPRRDQDFILTDVALGGERILIKARNTTAGAIVLYTSLILDFI